MDFDSAHEATERRLAELRARVWAAAHAAAKGEPYDGARAHAAMREIAAFGEDRDASENLPARFRGLVELARQRIADRAALEAFAGCEDERAAAGAEFKAVREEVAATIAAAKARQAAAEAAFKVAKGRPVNQEKLRDRLRESAPPHLRAAAAAAKRRVQTLTIERAGLAKFAEHARDETERAASAADVFERALVSHQAVDLDRLRWPQGDPKLGTIDAAPTVTTIERRTLREWIELLDRHAEVAETAARRVAAEIDELDARLVEAREADAAADAALLEV